MMSQRYELDRPMVVKTTKGDWVCLLVILTVIGLVVYGVAYLAEAKVERLTQIHTCTSSEDYITIFGSGPSPDFVQIQKASSISVESGEVWALIRSDDETYQTHGRPSQLVSVLSTCLQR